MRSRRPTAGVAGLGKVEGIVFRYRTGVAWRDFPEQAFGEPGGLR
ncbi:MAG: transposase [Betaproteobacteria bacterium]|nr:MAG: transposase [Betaproteobacteria bacterium]